MMMQGNYTQLHQISNQHHQENILPMTGHSDMIPQMVDSNQVGQDNHMIYQQHQYHYGNAPSDILSPTGSPVRQLKRLHPGATNTATELLRCKRKIDFMSHFGYASPNPYPSRPVNSVARRNERERNRVRLVNHGFALLRQHVPTLAGKAKKLSKVDTLKAAVEYIQQLKDVLEDSDSVSEEQHSLSPSSSPSSVSSGRQSPTSTDSSSLTSSTQEQSSQRLEEVTQSEDDLVDFASWFC